MPESGQLNNRKSRLFMKINLTIVNILFYNYDKFNNSC